MTAEPSPRKTYFGPKIIASVTAFLGIVLLYLPFYNLLDTYLKRKEDQIEAAWNSIQKANTGDKTNIGTADAIHTLYQAGRDLNSILLPNSFLASVHLPKAKLNNANLSGAVLDDANLEAAELRGANLSGASLTDANLKGAVMDGSNLRAANLRRASLTNSILRGADLTNADLTASDLRGADLRGAILTNATLFLADLNGDATQLQLANLADADMSAVDAREAHFEGARFDRTSLRGADLTDAKIADAILSDVDLRRAMLKGIDPTFFNKRSGIFDGACGETLRTDELWCGRPRSANNVFSNTSFWSRLLPNVPADHRSEIYYLLPNLTDEFQTESQKMIEAVFGELGYNVTSLDARGSADLQARQLVEALRRKPAAIILNAVDFTLLAKNIPKNSETAILVYDREITDAKVLLTSTSDAVGIGHLAATKAASILNERSRTVIQIMGDPGDNYSLAIRQGFDTTFLGYTSYDVFTKPALDWEPANALKVVADYDRAKTLDNVGVIFAHSAELLTPIANYLKNQVSPKKGVSFPMLISGNGAPSAISNMASGIQWAEIEQPLYAQVYGMALTRIHRITH